MLADVHFLVSDYMTVTGLGDIEVSPPLFKPSDFPLTFHILHLKCFNQMLYSHFRTDLLTRFSLFTPVRKHTCVMNEYWDTLSCSVTEAFAQPHPPLLQVANSRGDLVPTMVMITGLPVSGYSHEDVARLVWPYYDKPNLFNLYYHVIVLPLQRRVKETPHTCTSS